MVDGTVCNASDKDTYFMWKINQKSVHMTNQAL